ncbi:MAG: DNA-binding protein [Rhodospirillales bacterium]|nr:DNA-binding protein [Rhodospirillales bacterium]
MSNQDDGFSLMVHVPADEWAFVNRRLRYLEAVLIQVLQDRDRIQEWYDAAEIAALMLPGLPATKSGITRLANKAGWRRMAVPGRGGSRYQYHFASFPARAFDALIERILNIPTSKVNTTPVPEFYDQPEEQTTDSGNTAPPWLLPFMRLVKNDPHGDLSEAYKALPDQLPKGMDCPTLEEAAEVLVRFGIV